MKFACSPILTLAFAILVSLTVGVSLHAQDDPFNEDPFQASPFDEQPAAGEAVEAPPIDPNNLDDSQFTRKSDPVLESIIGADPKTPSELVTTIDLLMNLEQTELAKDYLNKLAQFQLNDEQNYSLYKRVGSDKLFRLQFAGQLGPLAAKFARSVFVGAENYAMNGQRVEALVNQVINNEDVYQRSVALNDLKLLGESGAARLVEKLVDNQLKDKWVRIREAIRRFGKQAEGPLLAARHSNSLKLQIESLYLLDSVPTDTSIQNAMLPLWSTSSTDLQRRVAQQTIRRLTGSVPSREQCLDSLYQSGRRYLMDQAVVDTGPSEQLRWWYWDANDRRLKSAWLTPRTVARNRGFRRAKDLIELDPVNRDYQKLYWVTRFESAKLTAGVGQEMPSVVVNTLAGSIEPELVNEVLAEALLLRRIPAAIAACEVIGTMCRDGKAGNFNFLGTQNGRASALVNALESGSIRLTNAACDAIHATDPKEAFVGSSTYLSSLVFTSQATGTRTAMVAHVSLEKARSIAALVNKNGYTSFPAVTPQQMFDQAKQDPDLQLMVITDSMSKPSFGELVQALRGSPRTRLIPILLMVKPENMNRAERLAVRFDSILVSPIAEDELVMARQIDNLQRSLDYRDADAIERSNQSVKSLRYLGQYASDRDRYPFFSLINYQKNLLGSLGTPVNAASTCELLGKLGTSEAQVRLVDMASNGQLPVSLRRIAADSFREAVQRSGIMLSRQQILAQYQRYNSSENQPQATQEVLSHLLDSIEKRW